MFLNQACEAGVTVCKTLMRMCPAIDHELAVSLSITRAMQQHNHSIMLHYHKENDTFLSYGKERKGRVRLKIGSNFKPSYLYLI